MVLPLNHNRSREPQEFNVLLLEAIDESIGQLLSAQVLEELYVVLREHYGITRDELPYRIETLYQLLKELFGVNGGETISRNIARRLYEKLGLQFEPSPALVIQEYVEIAKNKLNQVSRSG